MVGSRYGVRDFLFATLLTPTRDRVLDRINVYCFQPDRADRASKGLQDLDAKLVSEKYMLKDSKISQVRLAATDVADVGGILLSVKVLTGDSNFALLQ